MAGLQGLDRGLRALALVAASDDGLTVGEIAAALDVDRAIGYRIVATLEEHALISHGPGKRFRLGAGVLSYAGAFHPQLLRAAGPHLQQLADQVGAPVFISIAQGAEECVPVMEADPRDSSAPMRVGYRIGQRHPLTRGAGGIAILALHPPVAGEPDRVSEARKSGYCVTSGELQQGAFGVAAGFGLPGSYGASVSVVSMDRIDEDRVGKLVGDAAAALAQLATT